MSVSGCCEHWEIIKCILYLAGQFYQRYSFSNIYFTVTPTNKASWLSKTCVLNKKDFPRSANTSKVKQTTRIPREISLKATLEVQYGSIFAHNFGEQLDRGEGGHHSIKRRVLCKMLKVAKREARKTTDISLHGNIIKGKPGATANNCNLFETVDFQLFLQTELLQYRVWNFAIIKQKLAKGRNFALFSVTCRQSHHTRKSTVNRRRNVEPYAQFLDMYLLKNIFWF